MKRLIPALLITGTLALGMQPANAQLDTLRRVLDGVLGDPVPGLPSPTSEPSQPSYPQGALTRAMNLARQAAETENGGLNQYRAEDSMYGPASESPYKDNGDGTLTFTFLGGYPASPPSIQSIVTVALDASLVRVDYNGPIQTAGD